MKLEQIDPARTVMIVVDMQNDFVGEGAPMETPAARAMVPTLAAALDACRSAGIRLLYTAHVHRPDGSDLGNFKELDARIAKHNALVDGTAGADIYSDLVPAPGMSSRSIATARSSALIWISFFASGRSIR